MQHLRGQPINTNRTGFRDQHTQRGLLTDHGGQSSAQGRSGGATHEGGTIAVLFCTLHSALSAGCHRRLSQTDSILVASGHANFEKVKVDRSDTYLKNKHFHSRMLY